MKDDLRDGPGVRFPPPFVYAGFAALAWWLDSRWPLRPPEGLREVLDGLGLLLVAAGLALDLTSLALFWRQGTSAIPFRPATSFVRRGAYRFTRNPMYFGLTLLVAGLGLALERLGLVPAALLAALVIDRFVVPREERHLEARFGATYVEYKRRVRRWL
jgi:protein-S-isoprenylcysteine O-methyltransferase Ste14